ncbi:MAG: acetyl-CoA C-acetyltransferase [Woeseiaceae bacterium]|nr:acetyl-CoA C-acetyltransferase [Woeseiaceae bacterium]
MLNDGKSNRVAVIGGSRIPFCRANTGYKDSSNQEMMTATLKAIVKKYHLQGKRLGDVALGAVIKHSSDWNLSRECVIDSGLSINTPGVDMQRACGTSLETTLNIANKIALGQIEAGIAGGVDSISDAPIVYNDSFRKILLASVQGKSIQEKIKPWLRMKLRFLKPKLPGVKEPRTGLSMGESTEIIAKKYHISRQSQDELALESHINTAKAYDEGFYQNLVHPFKGIHEDNIMRRNIAIDKLKLLKTVFDKSERGSMTPGNSTSLTDGAAAVLLSSEEWAHNNNLRIEAYLTHCEIAAIDYINDEGLLMAPAYAVSSMLRKANLTLQDFDFYEIHEAFAAQTLATLKAWESIDFCRSKLNRDIVMGSIDSSKLNIKGGSLAIGHPFAATGARIIATMAKLLNEKGSGRGLISICTAGGMGITAIMEK